MDEQKGDQLMDSKRRSVFEESDHNSRLTVDQLAEALYEGTPHLQNLAEKLARQHGQAQALSFFVLMPDDVQNFWKMIARQLIAHSAEWRSSSDSSLELSKRERARLKLLPRD